MGTVCYENDEPVCHSGAVELARPPDSDAVVVLWTVGCWKCETWMTSQSVGWVVLYRDSELAVRRPVKTSDGAVSIAESWRKSVSSEADELGIAEPSRRRIPDRRKFVRGGRRAEDRNPRD
jgi:hypothetical protein